MENTGGFYKLEVDLLLHGPNFVLNESYELRRETKDEHSYPTDGWYWFEDAGAARTFFNLPEPEPVQDQPGPSSPGLRRSGRPTVQ